MLFWQVSNSATNLSLKLQFFILVFSNWSRLQQRYLSFDCKLCTCSLRIKFRCNLWTKGRQENLIINESCYFGRSLILLLIICNFLIFPPAFSYCNILQEEIFVDYVVWVQLCTSDAINRQPKKMSHIILSGL